MGGIICVDRVEIRHADGSWLRLEADNEVVAITMSCGQRPRGEWAIYCGIAEMDALVAAWLHWREQDAARAAREAQGGAHGPTLPRPPATSSAVVAPLAPLAVAASAAGGAAHDVDGAGAG